MTDIEIQKRANETINSLADKNNVPETIDILANALVNACKMVVCYGEACGKGELYNLRRILTSSEVN